MEDLRHAIADFKSAEKFIRPIIKITKHMEFVDGLEKREVEAIARVNVLENKITTNEETMKASDQALKEKQQNNKEEIRKISEAIQVEKNEVIKMNDEKIKKQQEELSLLEQQKKSKLKEFSNLEDKERSLKRSVTELQKVIKDSGNLVSSV